MKRIALIMLLTCVAPTMGHAQFGQPSADSMFGKESQRYSPHYYTVRSILRNHRSLRPQGSSEGALGSDAISVSEVDMQSDVIFQNGSYEFHAEIHGFDYKIDMRKSRGKWQLELRDEGNDRLVGSFVLEQ